MASPVNDIMLTMQSAYQRRSLADLYTVLKKSRVSLISLCVVAGAFALADQGQDVLLSMTETGKEGQMVFFEVLLLVWALVLWYTARFLLDQDFDAMRTGVPSAQETRTLWGEQFIPRFIGAAGLACVGYAMLRAIGEINSSIAGYAVRLRYLGMGNMVLAILLYVTLRNRAGIMIKMSGMLQGWFKTAQPLTYTVREQRISSFRAFPTWLRRSLIGSIVVSIVVWAVIFMSLQRAAPWFGTSVILVLGFIFITIIGAVLAWFGERWRMPLILFAVLYAGLIGPYADNHRVRTLEIPLAAQSSLDASDLYRTWLADMDARYGIENRPHPMFIVAASGGGIKAAYWTASVLSTLQARNESFAKHTIIISPVSGGALGALVFANLVVHAPNAGPRYPELAQAILSRDFLSPALGSLLFYDLPARFIPIRNLVPDRARALEQAWERAWDPGINRSLPEEFNGWKNDNPFEQGFTTLKYHERKHVIPTLLINGTSVESGRRILTTNLDTEFAYLDSLNLLSLRPKDIRMSTAAMMSARFTYISPAGTIDEENHVVDGGYYENSGSATAMQFYERIEQFVQRDRDKVRPVFIQIDNDYAGADVRQRTRKHKTDPGRIFPELQAPITAILKTREAHGESLEVRSFNTFGEDYYLYTFCRPDTVEAPLGWYLSRLAQQELKNQLLNNDKCDFGMRGNSANTEEILSLLTNKPKKEEKGKKEKART